MVPFIDDYHLAIGVWLQLFAVAKVTGIPESRYDVLVLVQSRICLLYTSQIVCFVILEPFQASLFPYLIAFYGRFILHVVNIPDGSFGISLGIVMRFYACFVCCCRHVEPQGFTLVQEIACTQPATGANYEDEQSLSLIHIYPSHWPTCSKCCVEPAYCVCW